MKTVEFNKMVSARLRDAKEVLTAKGTAYSSPNDRFKSFNNAARARNIAPAKALDGFMLKHLVSMWDAIDRMDKDSNFVPTEKWVSEKLGDIINYVLLLEGLIADHRQSLKDEI